MSVSRRPSEGWGPRPLEALRFSPTGAPAFAGVTVNA
jgi:hypothetical protein